MRGHVAAAVAVASWNWLWEAAQYRGEVFADKRYREELPELMDWIETLPEANIYLLIDTPTKYEAYSPLYHLLPKRVLDRHGLPCLRRPLWPVNGTCSRNEENLPTDFVRRLSHAFARHVWPYLNSGSPIGAFRQSDSLVLLRVLAQDGIVLWSRLARPSAADNAQLRSGHEHRIHLLTPLRYLVRMNRR